MIYDKSDAVTHRDAEYASLIEESKEESDTYEISTLAELFNELKDSEQVAVLVHVFSLLGLTVKKTIERIEDVESIEGEKMRQT